MRGGLGFQVEAIKNRHSVFGLSGSGAHCGVLACDASVPTYMLNYMTRDRTKGETLPVEFVVHKMTGHRQPLRPVRPGRHRRGLPADLNLIGHDNLGCTTRRWSTTSPHPAASGSSSCAEGYRMTVCNGVVTYENGEHTGAYPGRLVARRPLSTPT
ncbi:MAG: hypothetical protein R2749_12050 [Acidimicrobiales bacterium]